jgi:hypothetical protein
MLGTSAPVRFTNAPRTENFDPRCLIGLGGPDVEIALVGPQIYDYYEQAHRDANDSF